MSKVTLDINAFKALASDTRIDILKALDGKKMNLKDLTIATKLNKATLHEHLSKLNEAGLIKKKEREGHKWVYYKLSWKGASLLHPENTRIVVMFSITLISLFFGLISFIAFMIQKPIKTVAQDSSNFLKSPPLIDGQRESVSDTVIELSTSPLFLYVAVACLIVF